MCNCGPEVKVGEYQNQVAVPIPEHMGDYRDARKAAGLTDLIAIDGCALAEIQALWREGIRTYGSCCGHNIAASMVNVHADDDARMVAMGYIRWPYIPEGCCQQTFFLKTIPMDGVRVPQAPSVPQGEGAGSAIASPERSAQIRTTLSNMLMNEFRVTRSRADELSKWFEEKIKEDEE